MDYSTQNFQSLNLSGDNFINENQFFDTNLRRTNNINVGTEWRLNRLSLRGGYRYEQSPNVNVPATNPLQTFSFGDVESYSLGLGYNFGNFKIDVTYQDSSQINNYNFYSDFSLSNPAQFNIDNRILSTSLVINF